MKTNTKLFISLLRAVIVLVPIPSIILALVGVSSLIAIRNITVDYEEQMTGRVCEEISEDYENIHIMMYQLLHDSIIRDYVNSSSRNYYKEFLVQKELANKAHQNSIVDEIYVYLKDYDYIITNAVGNESHVYFDREIAWDYGEWLDYIKNNEQNYALGKDNSIQSPNVIMSPLVYMGENKGQIVIRLSDEYLRDRLSSLMIGGTKGVVLFHKGQMIFNIGEDLTDDEDMLYEAITKSGNIININNKTYGLVKSSVGDMGITVARLTRMSLLQYASWGLIALTALGILLLFIVVIRIVYIVVQKSYDPIKGFFASLSDGTVPDTEEDINEIANGINQALQEKNSLVDRIAKYEKEVSNLYLTRLYLQNDGDLGEVSDERRFGFEGTFYLSVCIVSGFEKNTRANSNAAEVQETIASYLDAAIQDYSRRILHKTREEQYFLINGSADSIEAFREDIINKTVNICEDLLALENISAELFVSSAVKGIASIHETYKEVGLLRTAREQIREEEIEKDQLSMNKIKEIIDCNLQDANISVASIAYELEISPSYLSRYFKKHENKGVLDYIHERRIEKAKEMFDTDNKVKIKEVAERVGFYNITTFIRVFKKYAGKTPGEYRERE